MRTFAQSTLTIGLAAAVLVGCGASQPPIGAPGAIPHSKVAGPSSYQVLHSFGGRQDGSQPYAGLINLNGTLYGTTRRGGAHRDGTVFTITTGGAEKVLHSFGGRPDGDDPLAGLVNVGGTLYGTTANGGTKYGVVFSITPSSSDKVLYAFRSKPDGRQPHDGLIDVGGTLYGTTFEGGDGKGANGEGTVFSITMNGTETVLHSFGRANDGAGPKTPLLDVGGTLYGTTAGGGAYGGGTVFTISTSGAEKVLYSFRGPPDGETPLAGLVDVGGTLYGTTYLGGAYSNGGTVYSISTSGSEKVLHSFGGGTDGKFPFGDLIDIKGTLYGTTQFGGTYGSGEGTVFSISTSGTEQVLHSFNGGADGRIPAASLINVNGTLYGTTLAGGTHGLGGSGTVFALTP